MKSFQEFLVEALNKPVEEKKCDCEQCEEECEEKLEEDECESEEYAECED